MDHGFFEHIATPQLVAGFNHDLDLIKRKGRIIDQALRRLTTVPHVPQVVIDYYEGKFQALIDADDQLGTRVEEIHGLISNPRLQIRALLPELQRVKQEATNLVNEIRNEVRERIRIAQDIQANPVQAPPVQAPQAPQAPPVQATQAPPVQATPVQATQAPPVQATPVQSTQAPPVQATQAPQAPPVQATQAPPVQTTPVQATQAPPVQATPVQATQDLVLPESQINNYSVPILQITVPIKLKSTQELQPQNQLISRFLSNTSFEFQLKCVKSQNNQNNIFLGINININPDFLNSASTKSTFVTLRIYNTSASFSRYHENDKSYVTGQLGQIFRIKNTDINISTNLGCKNMTFKKESFNFQIQAKSDLYTMVSSKPGFFCKPQLTLSYELFPFEKNLMKTTHFNKKQNTLVQHTITQNLNVISNSKIDSIKGKEFGFEVDAADMVQKSNLLRSESHVLASTTPSLPLIIKPSFFQTLGIFSLVFIGALIRGYGKKKNKKSAI